MEKAFNLIRVFDISFIAPGTILCAIAWKLGYPFTFKNIDTLTINSTGGVLAILAGIVAVYVSGLLWHGIQHAVNEVLWKLLGSSSEKPWYCHLGETHESRDNLATYCWYERATCWNLCAAIAVGGILCYCQSAGISAKNFLGCATVVAALIFGFAGRDFDRAHKKIVVDPPDQAAN